MATLIGSLGTEEEDGDLEFHDARTPLSFHANVETNGSRMAYVRSLRKLFEGVSLCDHDGLKKGSEEWIRHHQTKRNMSRRDLLAAASLQGGLNAWKLLGQQQQRQLSQLH